MRTAALVVILGLVLAACGGGDSGPTATDGIASISMSATTIELLAGRTEQLVATPKDAQGATIASAPAPTWSSSNPSIATVNSSGLVTALVVGSADITATVSGARGVTRVTVISAPTLVTVNMPGLTFAPFRATLKQGGTVNYVFPALAHNVMFEQVPGAPNDIPGQVSNQTVSRTFPTARLYLYECTLHPGMKGEVDVVP